MKGYAMSAERQPSAFDEAIELRKQRERQEEFQRVQKALDLDALDESDREAYDSFQEYLEQRPETPAEAKKLNAEYRTQTADRENETLFSSETGEDPSKRFEGMKLKEVAESVNSALEGGNPTLALDAKHYIDDKLHNIAQNNAWSKNRLESHQKRLASFYDTDKINELEEKILNHAEAREQQDEQDRQEQLAKFEEVRQERRGRGEDASEDARGLREEDVVLTGTRLPEKPPFSDKSDMRPEGASEDEEAGASSPERHDDRKYAEARKYNDSLGKEMDKAQDAVGRAEYSVDSSDGGEPQDSASSASNFSPESRIKTSNVPPSEPERTVLPPEGFRLESGSENQESSGERRRWWSRVRRFGRRALGSFDSNI